MSSILCLIQPFYQCFYSFIHVHVYNLKKSFQLSTAITATSTIIKIIPFFFLLDLYNQNNNKQA